MARRIYRFRRSRLALSALLAVLIFRAPAAVAADVLDELQEWTARYESR